MRFAALAATALLLSGCAAAEQRIAEADAREAADALDGRTAGATVDCIPSTATLVPAGATVIARDGNRLWRSIPVGRCIGLGGDPILIVEPTGGQICRNDLFRTLPRGGSIPGPICRLGAFTAYPAIRGRSD